MSTTPQGRMIQRSNTPLTIFLLLLLAVASGCDVFSGGDVIYSGGRSYGSGIEIAGDRVVVAARASDQAFVLSRSTGFNTDDELAPPSGLRDGSLGGDLIFGWDAAIGDQVAIVGAPVIGVASRSVAGRAYIFENDGEGWNRVAELQAVNPDLGRRFGTAVAAAAGRVAILSGPATERITENLIEPAAVVVYERSLDGWSESARIEETDYERPTGAGGFSAFGDGLDMDDQRIVVGSPGQDVGGVRGAGVVRVYDRAGSEWSLSSMLSASSALENDALGSPVALDGSTIVASANGRTIDGVPGVGSVYVFRNGAQGWVIEEELKSGDGTPRDLYGRSVSVSGDRVAIGAPGRNRSSGAVDVWVRSPSGTWSLEETLSLQGQPTVSFGESVALSGDLLLIGAIGVDNGRGAVYAYKRGSDGWTLSTT